MKVTVKTGGTVLIFDVAVDDLPVRLRERLLSWLKGEVLRRGKALKDAVATEQKASEK